MSVKERTVQFTLDAGKKSGEEAVVTTYLESEANSPHLVVYIHGMGLDADDYRAYIDKAVVHGIALTLPGFANNEKPNSSPLLSLDEHVKVLSEFLSKARAEHPDKRLSLVGFSLGADLILRLAEYWDVEPGARSALHGVLLLDPNINHSTMNLSGVLARADILNPLPEMKRIIASADAKSDFAHICKYFGRIAKKDFRPIKQHATDFWAWWRPDGDYMLIVKRLRMLQKVAEQTRVVFSASYKHHLQPLAGELEMSDLSSLTYEITELGHFDLIGEDLLSREVTNIVP